MRKNIPAFICGLIGSLFTLFWGFWVGILGEAASAILGSASDGGAPAEVTILYILGWLAFLGGIVGIVGCSLALKDTKKAQWNLLAAAITSSALLGYLFAKSAPTGTMITTLILILLLPAILLIVSTVLAFCTKDKEVPATQVIVNNSQPAAPVQKTLEDELMNLKNMKDKGLLTEEEYAEAKKAALNKYSA